MTFKRGDRVRVASDVGNVRDSVGTVKKVAARGALVLLDGDGYDKFFFQSELKREHHLTIRHLGKVGRLWLWGWKCSCGESSGSTGWCLYGSAALDAGEHYASATDTYPRSTEPRYFYYYPNADKEVG